MYLFSFKFMFYDKHFLILVHYKVWFLVNVSEKLRSCESLDAFFKKLYAFPVIFFSFMNCANIFANKHADCF